jgi:hypothetical protein
MHHLPEGIEMPELVFAARSSSGRAIRAIQRYCGLLPSQFWAWFFPPSQDPSQNDPKCLYLLISLSTFSLKI